MSDEITYSPRIKGAAGNYGWSVRFDKHRGFVGITQETDDGLERVLLSPEQAKRLKAFLGGH